MRTTSDLNEVLATIIGEGARHGLMHAVLDDAPLDGRIVPVGGRELVNFASCSYMGLETDPRLIEGAIAATRRYGTQLSASRLFLSAAPYAELEHLLSGLAGGYALATPTTSLGHLAALPVLIEETDAVLYDQRLHHSVQTALRLLPGTGVHLELVKHNRLDLLEDRVRDLRHRHRRIWYVADGIYSIFGDRAPLGEIRELLDRYPQLSAYFDDAHGTGWLGACGRGHVLGELAGHPSVVVALSLNKSFAAAGGCLVFPDAATRDRVRTCGGPLNFSGPIQPPMLGAAIASAKAHLAPDWADRQAELHALIDHAHTALAASGLPLASPGGSPILFVGMGLPRAAHLMGERLMEAGYFVTAATFPGVPVKQSGMRLSLTRHLTKADVDGFVAAMQQAMPGVLAEVGTSIEAVREAFHLEAPKVPVPAAVSLDRAVALPPTFELRVEAALRLEHHRTIASLDAAEWDALLGRNGTYTAAGLAALEAIFATGRTRPEDDWKFHYYLVRDRAGKAVLATFFTEALWKDDMVARKEVSEAVEAERARRGDPYYLASRTFAMGSLLSEGAHLWLDRQAPWREALDLVLQAAEAERAACGASVLALRDFDGGDAALDAHLRDRGFIRFQMPASSELALAGRDEATLLADLSQGARRVFRQSVEAHAAKYAFEVIRPGGRGLTAAEVAHFHALYLQVKARNLGFNTFALPEDVFAHLAGRDPWEIVIARLAPEHGGPADGRAVGVGACFVGPGTYTPLVMGLDYDYVYSHGLYRTMLWQAPRRARALGSDTLFLGVGAPLEKQRIGAHVTPQYAYMQATSHDNLDELVRFMENVGRTKRRG
jgi:7-keto-8-aminopelargonate synthetase-like enzyme